MLVTIVEMFLDLEMFLASFPNVNIFQISKDLWNISQKIF